MPAARPAAAPPARPGSDESAAPRGPRLAQLPPGRPASRALATKRIAAVRKLHGARRRAAWRQRLVDAERGLVLGFRRDGVLAGHVFVLTLSVVAGLTFDLSAVRWAVLGLALATAMGAELFGQVLAALAAAIVRAGGGAEERPGELAAAVRLGSAAVAISAAGATAALIAVFAPPVLAAFGG